jgi:hypothetical protein
MEEGFEVAVTNKLHLLIAKGKVSRRELFHWTPNLITSDAMSLHEIGKKVQLN